MTSFPQVIRVSIVAPDSRLQRLLRAVGDEAIFETVRYRSLENALKKTSEIPGSVLLVQWTPQEFLEHCRISTFRKTSSMLLLVYCPELVRETVLDAEELRFALMQFGATAVFSRIRELSTAWNLIRRHLRHFPASRTSWSQEVWNALPWKPAR